MALSNEDHKDIKGALGKAMANKISKVTNDRKSWGRQYLKSTGNSKEPLKIVSKK